MRRLYALQDIDQTSRLMFWYWLFEEPQPWRGHRQLQKMPIVREVQKCTNVSARDAYGMMADIVWSAMPLSWHSMTIAPIGSKNDEIGT